MNRARLPHSVIPGYNAYVQLPEAYRSLSRLSSAPDAKAFPLRSSSLDLFDRSSFIQLPSSQFYKLLQIYPFLVSLQVPSIRIMQAHIFSFPFLAKLLFTLNFCFLTVAFSYRFSFTLCSVFKVHPRAFARWWAKVDSNHRPHDYQSCALAS